MHVRLNNEPLEEEDCFQNLGQEMEGCVTQMNEGYKAWGALKSVLSNRGLGITAKKCPYERVIVPREHRNGV